MSYCRPQVAKKTLLSCMASGQVLSTLSISLPFTMTWRACPSLGPSPQVQLHHPQQAMAAAPRGKVCFHVQLGLRTGTAPGAAQGMGLLLRDGLAGARELLASRGSLHTRQGRQARGQECRSKSWRKEGVVSGGVLSQVTEPDPR